jgi:hypothetical protein
MRSPSFQGKAEHWYGYPGNMQGISAKNALPHFPEWTKSLFQFAIAIAI